MRRLSLESLLSFIDVFIMDIEGSKDSGTDSVSEKYLSLAEQDPSNQNAILRIADRLCKSDAEKAARLYQEVASKGNPVAWRKLADEQYRHERYAEALQSYLNAANTGDVSSLVLIGMYFKIGIAPLSEDHQRAAQFFKAAAYQDSPAGCYFLGMCYLEGLGVERNEFEAQRTLSAAAELGDPRALYELGIQIDRGVFSESYRGEAWQYIHRASVMGLSEARTYLRDRAIRPQD